MEEVRGVAREDVRGDVMGTRCWLEESVAAERSGGVERELCCLWGEGWRKQVLA